MSPIFVLIWLAFNGSVGMATGSQEFTSEERCQAAAQALNKGSYGVITTYCVRK